MVFQNIFQGIITELACRPFNSLLNKNAFYNIRNNRIIQQLLRNPLGTPRYGMNKHLNSLISYNMERMIHKGVDSELCGAGTKISAQGFQPRANQSESARSPVLKFNRDIFATTYEYKLQLLSYHLWLLLLPVNGPRIKEAQRKEFQKASFRREFLGLNLGLLLGYIIELTRVYIVYD